MEIFPTFVLTMTMAMVWLHPATGLQFLLHKEECFTQTVEDDGDLVQVSFVVISSDRAWQYDLPGIDLSIEGPGNFRRDIQNEPSEKLEFTAPKSGPYKFCLKNNSPYAETVDIDVLVGHIPYYDDERAKDDHIDPLMGQIAKLEEAIYSVQFEQHWLYAQTEQQSTLNEKLGKRLWYKAVCEAFALIGASVLQVYLLRRLFDKKLNSSRV